MARQRKRRDLRVKQSTLLVVGEGAHERAFLEHMKQLYDRRDNQQRLTVKAADGGSPGDVLRVVRKRYQHIDYDRRVILLDADVPIPRQVEDDARRLDIVLLLSQPICLEGMLLDVLGQRAPGTAKACKSCLHPQLTGPPTERSSYAGLFPKAVLDDTTKPAIVELRRMMRH
ncbi:hypothetical protein QEJ81_13030 [Halomonas icarae]|uniref:RloB domain-containing protein n=1 Tax=Halomonas icarae TaxID=2691040 RepID=A0A7X4VWI2_9GAMM|nr:hypothetical protein [Halomonas icarae]MDR5903034.1 hypothetical protein [Halomonas icarae]NAW11590.1 hypothetical protein [Halomonas icarae]